MPLLLGGTTYPNHFRETVLRPDINQTSEQGSTCYVYFASSDESSPELAVPVAQEVSQTISLRPSGTSGQVKKSNRICGHSVSSVH